MARLSDLRGYNDLRITDNWLPFDDKTISFENQKGDTLVITPMELKSELNKFIDLQFSSMTIEDIENKKEHLKRELDRKLNEFELSLKQHVEDKINKITQSVIENTTNRIFEDRIKQEVKQRLRKLLEE
jgi:hypothetical protein